MRGPGDPALHTLTDFADAAVTLPLFIAVWLFLASRRTAVLGWVAAVGGAFAAILMLKLVFGIVPPLGAPFDIRSPSGHTATATAAYGGLALLLLGRRAGLAAAVVTAVAIGASRLALDMHTLPEVVVGGLVGTGAVALLARTPPSMRRHDAILLAVLAGLLVTVEHGRHAEIEPALRHLEGDLRL